MKLTRVRAAALGAALITLGLVAVPGVSAHTGASEFTPVIEEITPQVDGLDITVAYSVNYQFVVENTTDKEFTVFAGSGEPFLRIGPEGVFGNFASPTWYDARAPEGLETVPEGARPGADVPPEWRQVSRQPSYGWFDHRLHPAGSEKFVSDEVRQSKKTVIVGEPWEVLTRYGDVEGRISGRFEFQPVLGTYRSVLRSSTSPAEGVTVQVSPSSTRTGVPAMFVDNASAQTVTVLGEAGEPFLRLSKVAEVNTHSPTWHAIVEAQGRTVEEDTLADPEAAPAWKEVQGSPKWGWPELRAAPPVTNPSEEVAEADQPTTVKRWTIPLLVGDERRDIDGVTEFVPTGVAAAGQVDEPEGEAEEDEGSGLGTAVLLSIALWSVALAIFFSRRRKARMAGPPPGPVSQSSGPRPDRPGRRTKSTPKPRR